MYTCGCPEWGGEEGLAEETNNDGHGNHESVFLDSHKHSVSKLLAGRGAKNRKCVIFKGLYK